MCILKFIGPFLRINSINKNNINNELFHLSKESVKHIVLNSKCGIVAPLEKFKNKSFSNNDINTIKGFSPLLCVYKKADPKLKQDHGKLLWDNEKFKKEINISTNAFMTLCLLDLLDYYKNFKDISQDKYLYYNLYMNLCKNQLIFFASYLRNIEGIFVDKVDDTEVFSEDLVFEDKNTKFKFSDQALLMCAYYKYSTFNDKSSDEFKKFSLDILNMLLSYKDEIYNLPLNELNKLCFGLNIFYDCSKDENAKLLLMDICDLISNKYENKYFEGNENSVEYDCLVFINLSLINSYEKVLKFDEICGKVITKLLKMYDENLGIFCYNTEDKKLEFSSQDIMYYLFCLNIYSSNKDNTEYNQMIYNIFKYQIVNSGLILSWPEAPNLDDIERYADFSLKSSDLLDEQHFIMPNISTPEKTLYAPIFTKNIYFQKKKGCFKQNKTSFYSEPNFTIFFMIQYFKNRFKNIDKKPDTPIKEEEK
ncbi:hypothetical protein ACER0A_009360 [Haloimpatiens sp. FM7315]|uniref:hypothetical protein n=1 Tax=Haloimpatiens sp. FM7315 TaxID=3298609 RepID=UPI00370AC52F